MRELRRHGRRLRILCTVLVLLAGCGKSITQNKIATEQIIETPDSQTPPANETVSTDRSEQLSPTQLFFRSAEKDLNNLPAIVIDETTEMFSDWDNVWPLLTVGAVSVIMHNSTADRDIADNFDDHRALSTDVDEVFSNIGGPGFQFGVAGLWYAISAGKQDQLNKQRSWTMLKALSVNGALTLGFKLIRDNRTPNDKWLGWPSGHTSSSFTVAAVLDEIYGPEVGFPAYLGAGFVGYRMMDSSDHWASDVIFGAVLGYLVGHHVAGKDKQLEIAGFNIIPYIDTNTDESVIGISLLKQF